MFKTKQMEEVRAGESFCTRVRRLKPVFARADQGADSASMCRAGRAAGPAADTLPPRRMGQRRRGRRGHITVTEAKGRA